MTTIKIRAKPIRGRLFRSLTDTERLFFRHAQKRNPKIIGIANARNVDLQDNPPAINNKNRAILA